MTISECHHNDPDDCSQPEILLAAMLKDDLGVNVDAQALRMFIRWRWNRVQKLAHRIHDAK